MDYVITKVLRVTFLDDAGAGVDGYRVYFRMESGQVDYVNIAANVYSKDTAEMAIEAKIQTHLDVLGTE